MAYVKTLKTAEESVLRNNNTCYIVGAGEPAGELPVLEKGDLLIACDGGYAWCLEKGLNVDLVAGDFDSLGYTPAHPHTVQLPVEKDETDTGWAVNEGWRRGYREFVILGGTGGRISHTMANIQLLAMLASKGGHGILIGKKTWYRVICEEEICFDAEETGILSVFCMGDRAEGVFERGLKYLLENATLTKENPIGVSNEFIGKESSVSVGSGMLLLIGEQN